MNYDPKTYWEKAGKDYFKNFKANELYRNQEKLMVSVVGNIVQGEEPITVLEIGIGFGRVAKMILDAHAYDAGTRMINEYLGLDVSTDQIENAKRYLAKYIPSPVHLGVGEFVHWRENDPIQLGFDIGIAVEVLMHIPPDRLPLVVEKLLRATDHVITIDWYEPSYAGPVYQHNFNHDYFTLYSKMIEMGLARKLTYVEVGDSNQYLFHLEK